MASTTEQYYDELGRVVWTKDAVGVCSYTAYHPVTGGVALRIEDVNPASPGTEVTSGSTDKWDAWTVYGADDNKPTRGSGLASAIAQTTKTEYDSQGRPYKRIDAAGNEHYTVYLSNRTIRFPYWDGTTSQMPMTITVTNDAGQITETYQAPAGLTQIDTNAQGEPTDFGSDPSQGVYVSWTRMFYDNTTGQLVKTLNYHNIPSSGAGSHGTNYYVSGVEYDAQGRVKTSIQSSTDDRYQVSQPVYDWRGRTIESKTGAGDITNLDTGANGDLLSSGTSLTLPTLTTVSKTVYDSGNVGDNRVTSRKSYYGSGVNDYIETQPQYTWRGFVRGNITKNGNGGTPVDFGPWQVSDFDWLGRTVASATYDVQPTWATVLGNDNYAATIGTNRHNLSKSFYDDLGRVYKTHRYPGSQTNGHFAFRTYRDAAGRTVATLQTNGMASEMAYDALGRNYQTRSVTVLESIRYSGVDFQYRDPQPDPDLSSMSGGDDKVVSISHREYDDDNGHVMIGSHQLSAMHDDDNGIDLENDDDYIRETSYTWHDDIQRQTHGANYGSGNGTGNDEWKYTSVPTRPASAPASSDSIHVASVTYNSKTGRQETTTDPKGREVKIWFDDAGRQTFVSENHTNFDPDNISTTVGGGTDNDEDRVTGFTYNGVGVVKQIAYNEGEDDQETINLYEDTVSASRVTNTIYPDSSDTTSAGSDQVKITYNVDGSRATQTDQRGVVHTFTYDTARRLEIDGATTIPGSVDGAIKSIKSTYDSLGRRTKITSYANNDGTGTVVNEVERSYDTYGQMVTEYQEHDGAVNPSTSWNVDYTYNTTYAEDNIFENNLYLEKTTYHSGQMVYRNYGTGSSLNHRLSRVQRIRETPGSSGTTLGEYQHNGDGRLVQTDLQEVDIRNSLHGNDSDGVYEQLDRFGRVSNQPWSRYASPSQLMDRFYYTYDRVGNRLTKDIPTSVYSGNDQDQKFVYDELNRLVQFEEGTLSGTTISSRQQEQQWDRDQLGNWTNFKERDTDTGSTWDTDEDREHNAANEITSIDSVTTSVIHDAAGNMTRIPDLASGDEGIYDAWNRLVIIAAPAAGLQQNEYDGLHRRIVRDDSFAGGNGDKIHFYYSGQQVVEERKEVRWYDRP